MTSYLKQMIPLAFAVFTTGASAHNKGMSDFVGSQYPVYEWFRYADEFVDDCYVDDCSDNYRDYYWRPPHIWYKGYHDNNGCCGCEHSKDCCDNYYYGGYWDCCSCCDDDNSSCCGRDRQNACCDDMVGFCWNWNTACCADWDCSCCACEMCECCGDCCYDFSWHRRPPSGLSKEGQLKWWFRYSKQLRDMWMSLHRLRGMLGPKSADSCCVSESRYKDINKREREIEREIFRAGEHIAELTVCVGPCKAKKAMHDVNEDCCEGGYNGEFCDGCDQCDENNTKCCINKCNTGGSSCGCGGNDSSDCCADSDSHCHSSSEVICDTYEKNRKWNRKHNKHHKKCHKKSCDPIVYEEPCYQGQVMEELTCDAATPVEYVQPVQQQFRGNVDVPY